MMRKKQYLAALLAVMLFTLSACGELTPGSSEENAPQQQMTVGESNREEAQQPTDNSRIPTELEGQGVFVSHYQDWDQAKLPSQYLSEMDDTALMLIEQVQNVTLSAAAPRAFDGIEHARTNDLLRISLKNTPPIDFDMKVERDENGKVIAQSQTYPNHTLTKLLQNEQEEGRDLREFYYQEDVAAVYSQLFGSGRTLGFQDLCPKYYYYAREGVFAHKGERNDPQIWPMLVQYQDSDTVISADLLLTEGSDPQKPLIYIAQDGSIVELTADNYRQELAGEPVYRYTFRKEGEQLHLDGIRQVGVLNQDCSAVVNVELPTTEEAPQLKTPERMMLSSGAVQSRIDLQKEYEGGTALEYLMELLGKAEKIEGAAGNNVLAAGGSDTLTLTLGYTQGEEAVLSVNSKSYLPGILESYVTFSFGSQQFLLPQEEYENLTACLESCKAN